MAKMGCILVSHKDLELALRAAMGWIGQSIPAWLVVVE